MLEPLHADGQSSADIDALLGTILYWDGDLTGAKKLFLDALRKDPAQTAAARQLREIQASSASWLRVSPAFWHDDQPLDRATLAIEAGWFVTPLLSITVRSQPERFSVGGRANVLDERSGGVKFRARGPCRNADCRRSCFDVLATRLTSIGPDARPSAFVRVAA